MIVQLLLLAASLSAPVSDAVQEVICAETAFSRAAERRDKEAFLGMVDPDARFVTSSVARGHDEIAEAWDFAFREGGTRMRWRPETVEVSSDGALAISRGPYRAISTNQDGSIRESWGTFISTWRRNADGQWRVLFDTGGETDMTPDDNDRAVLSTEPECP